MITLVALLFGCASNRSSVSSANSNNLVLGQQIVNSAKSKIGSKYQYAARGPQKFDCSGLVDYIYRQYNLDVGGSAASMSLLGKAIDIEDARSGDLIFYKKNGRVFHVSIISEGSGAELRVIHSTTSRGVIEEDILASPYWSDKMYKIISLSSLDQ